MQGVSAFPAASTATREEAKVSKPIARTSPGSSVAVSTAARAVRISSTTWSASIVLVPSAPTVKECVSLWWSEPTSRPVTSWTAAVVPPEPRSIPTTRGPWASSAGMWNRGMGLLLRSSGPPARGRRPGAGAGRPASIGAGREASAASPRVATGAGPLRPRPGGPVTAPSSQHRLPEMLALGAAGRDREHRRTDRGGPLVQQVQLVQPSLDRQELARQVGLERHEDLSGLRDRVTARRRCGVVVVRPTEDLLVLAVVDPVRPPHVGELPDHGEAVRGLGREVGVGVLRAAGQRSAVVQPGAGGLLPGGAVHLVQIGRA